MDYEDPLAPTQCHASTGHPTPPSAPVPFVNSPEHASADPRNSRSYLALLVHNFLI